MKTWTLNEIAQVEFIFENMVSVIFQHCEFKHFQLQENGELECEIKGVGQWGDTEGGSNAPVQRLSEYRDIVALNLVLQNGEGFSMDTKWYYDDSYACNFENDYQITKLHRSWNHVTISINKYNKKYSLEEVLKLPTGTVVADEYDNHFIVKGNCLHHYHYVTENMNIDSPVKTTLSIVSRKYHIV